MTNGLQLPLEIVDKISTATLPQNYEKAKQALAECESLDECAQWADKAAALAAYSRQADDPELENHAKRIRARAKRRMGEILLTFDARGGDRSKTATPPGFAQEGISGPVIRIVSRTEAAADAGISEHKALTATRIASMNADDFEAAIEAPKAPGTTLLAKMARMNQPPRDNASTIRSGDFREVLAAGDCKRIIEAVQRLARYADSMDADRVIDLLSTDENAGALPTVHQGLVVASRIKAALDKAGLGAKPFLKTVE
jgi:hypothetical protein